MTVYYYILMSQTQMLRNEVLEEILRERTNYYFAKSKTIDFWITISPAFVTTFALQQKIQTTNFFRQRKTELLSQKEPFYSALISSDKEFIRWIRLRLGYFEDLDEDIENNRSFDNSISDGVTGSFEVLPSNSISPLISNSKFLHPDILLETYKQSLNLYYSLEKSLNV